jgi:phi13 family phage major tail protein
MAYIGLARLIIAQPSGKGYIGGVRLGRAIKIEISPNYEDISDYLDVNDLEQEEMFSYADVKLEISEIPAELESAVFGHESTRDEVVSRDTDTSGYVGMGMRSREVEDGQTRYVAIWLYKVKFSEDGQEHSTKKDSIDYETQSITGRAIPLDNGKWRIKKLFDTKYEADSWLDKMAGITEEREERQWHM